MAGLKNKETIMKLFGFLGFKCNQIVDDKKCRGELIKSVSDGENIMKCVKCGQKYLVGPRESEPDSTPANFGKTWFRR